MEYQVIFTIIHDDIPSPTMTTVLILIFKNIDNNSFL